MKGAKIMLIALAVLATVGGVLAFKANNKFVLRKYCTKASDGYCTLFTYAAPANTPPAAFTTYYETTFSTATFCALHLACRAASTSFTYIEP